MKSISVSYNSGTFNFGNKWRLNAKDEEKKQSTANNTKLVVKMASGAENSNRVNTLMNNPVSALNKIKMGGHLTEEELQMLKEKYPTYYKKVMEKEIEEKREHYREELENCDTIEEVEETRAAKIQEIHMSAQSISQSGMKPEYKEDALLKLGSELAEMTEEYTKFVNSAKYQSLPSEVEMEMEEYIEEVQEKETGDIIIEVDAQEESSQIPNEVGNEVSEEASKPSDGEQKEVADELSTDSKTSVVQERKSAKTRSEKSDNREKANVRQYNDNTFDKDSINNKIRRKSRGTFVDKKL